MQVNTEIYGEKSTWRRDADGFSSNSAVPDDMQFKRGEFNDIANYVSQGRLEQGEAIDYSICYAGQAEGMPLTSLRTWDSVYSGGQWSGVEYKHSAETGWFFGHHHDGIDSTTSKLVCSNGIFKNDGTGLSSIKDYYWLPDGVAGNYPKQPSQRLIPIVSFPTRGCYFGIRCRIFNPSTNSTQYKYLDELRTGDWSAWKLFRAWGELYTYRTSDADFSGVPTGSSHYCCVAISEIIKFKPTVSSVPDAMPVLSYATLIRENIPIFGWIDNEWSIKRVSGVWHCMQRSFNSTTQTSSTAPIWIDSVPNTTFNQVLNDDWGIGFEAYCDITADNLEAIRKAAAAYGLFFTEKDPSGSSFRTNPSRWTHADMFCGVLDSQGIGHGEYTRGTDNRDNPVYSMGTSENSGYNPGGGGGGTDPNTYSNITGFNTLETNANLLKCYVLDKTNVEILGDDLWTICDSLSAQDYENFDGKIKDEFLTTNPIDSIISLIRYPFDIPHFLSNTKTPVRLGKSIGTAEGYRTYNITFGVNYAGINIFPRFGDCFLDYAPYTKYELYVPFCGTVEINAGDVLGHTLNLQLRVDLSTGSVVAYIMADQLVIGTAKGSCGAEQVLNGTQSATVNANIINGLITYEGVSDQQMNMIGRAIYPTGLIKDVLDPFGQKAAWDQLQMQEDQAEFNLTHIQTPVHKMGSPSPLLAWLQEFNARLMIYYPEGDVIDTAQPPKLNDEAIAAFGHLKGFATATPGTVSSFQSAARQNYLRGSIFADDIPCTVNERSRIRSLFADGVYLPKTT